MKKVERKRARGARPKVVSPIVIVTTTRIECRCGSWTLMPSAPDTAREVLRVFTRDHKDC